MVILTVASLGLLLLFVAILVAGVTKIMWALEEIGSGPTSSPPPLLGRIRWGVRAIEQQTGGLSPNAQRLAASLRTIEASLAHLRSRIPGLSRRSTG